MDELRRGLYTILDFVLDIVGMVLGFLVRLANHGLATYNSSGLIGKLLGILLLFGVAWVLGAFIHWLSTTVARNAFVVIALILVVVLLLVIADPQPASYSRRY